MIFDTKKSLFDEGTKLTTHLKNPNEYREAMINEAIKGLSRKKINEFVNSEEAKYMVSEGYITDDTIKDIEDCPKNNCFKVAVCHIAKERNDELWNKLVDLRLQERRIMNLLVEKYKDEAKNNVNNMENDVINKCIPEYFRHD